MKEEFTFRAEPCDMPVHAIKWLPDHGEPKAVLQIIHGMIEFIGRYDRFAEFMASNGYVIAGIDLPGHGSSVNDQGDHGYFGEPDGNASVISAIHGLRTIMQKEYPGLPYLMLGHSMGSFFVQQYVMMYGEGIRAMAVMGTGWQPSFNLKLARLICRLQAARHGWRYRSPLLTKMALGSANKRIPDAKTKNDWLTRDEKIVAAYNANPWDNFMFTVNAFDGMFKAIGYVEKPDHVRRLAPDLPVFFLSGAEDPVGNYGEGPKKAAGNYRNCRMKNVQMKLYPGDRHELLNETDHEKPDEDLLAFFDDAVNSGKS